MYKDYKSTTTELLESFKEKLSNQIAAKYTDIDNQVSAMGKKVEALTGDIRISV